MTGRAGLRIALHLSPLRARSAALVGWFAAAALATLVLDVPLHPPARANGASPLPELHEPATPLPRTEEPKAPPKREKLVEIAPWEQVPT